MTKIEIGDLLTYLFADHGAVVSDAKVDVWFDQFEHIDSKLAMTAARILNSRKTYGLPKVHDFALAIAEVTSLADSETWGEAWDAWVKLARKYGYYCQMQAVEQYEQVSPRGRRALGTSVSEWFEIKSSEVPIFRAQFRQRYEALLRRDQNVMVLPPSVKTAIEQMRSKQIETKARHVPKSTHLKMIGSGAK